MALRRRSSERQQEFWIPAEDVTRAPRHVFYERLNQLLDEAGFDRFVEELAAPFYARGGRSSVPPGVYFRMLFVGYFEDIDSQRACVRRKRAWRCADPSSGLPISVWQSGVRSLPIKPPALSALPLLRAQASRSFSLSAEDWNLRWGLRFSGP